MGSDNWCPREIALADSMLPELSMFSASYIRRGRKDRNHQERSCDRHISLYEEVEKNQPQVEKATGALRTVTGCKCAAWPPNPELHQLELSTIVSKKKIPYIELREARKAPTLEVQLGSLKNTSEATAHVPIATAFSYCSRT